MRSLLLATTLVITTITTMAGAGRTQAKPAAPFDPAGKWTYATLDEQGVQISGSMTITGKAGAYAGGITTGEGQEIPITDVFTSANGMVVLFSLPDGATGVVRITRKADGTTEAGWAAVRNVIAVKVERAK